METDAPLIALFFMYLFKFTYIEIRKLLKTNPPKNQNFLYCLMFVSVACS